MGCNGATLDIAPGDVVGMGIPGNGARRYPITNK